MISQSVEPRPMVLDSLPRVPCQWLLLVEPPIRHLELRNLILKWDCHFRSILGVASSQAIFPLPWLAIAFRYISMSCFVCVCVCVCVWVGDVHACVVAVRCISLILF